MPTISTVASTVKLLLARYNADYVFLFGSYARGEETPDSDINIVVFGGNNSKKTYIFAFAEDMREALGTKVDAFEICEINKGTPFYDRIMKEGIKIA